jgi:hypothetical protein
MARITLNKLLMQRAISAIFCHFFVEPTPSLARGKFQYSSNPAKGHPLFNGQKIKHTIKN